MPSGKNGVPCQVRRFLEWAKAKSNTRLGWQKSRHVSPLSSPLQKWPQASPQLLVCGFLRPDCTLSVSDVARAATLSSLFSNVCVLIVPPLPATDSSLLGSFWLYVLLPLYTFLYLTVLGKNLLNWAWLEDDKSSLHRPYCFPRPVESSMTL